MGDEGQLPQLVANSSVKDEVSGSRHPRRCNNPELQY